MLGLILKVVLTAAFIVALSEIGKRVPSLAGLIVALPLATAMTMTLMHLDGEGPEKIAAFARSAIVYIPPSTVFIVGMWLGLANGFGFWPTVTGSLAVTGLGFWAYASAMAWAGVKLL
jgi:uncharacterized membrane protein (Fun14 family)